VTFVPACSARLAFGDQFPIVGPFRYPMIGTCSGTDGAGVFDQNLTLFGLVALGSASCRMDPRFVVVENVEPHLRDGMRAGGDAALKDDGRGGRPARGIGIRAGAVRGVRANRVLGGSGTILSANLRFPRLRLATAFLLLSRTLSARS